MWLLILRSSFNLRSENLQMITEILQGDVPCFSHLVAFKLLACFMLLARYNFVERPRIIASIRKLGSSSVLIIIIHC